ELLGDAGSTLTDTVVASIPNQRARHTKNIQARMLEETPVLDRRDGVDQYRGQIVESELAPDCAFGQYVVRQRFRSEGDRIHRDIIAAQFRHAAIPIESHAHDRGKTLDRK